MSRIPTVPDESWKYAPLAELAERFDRSTPAAFVEVTSEQLDGVVAALPGTRLVYVNGVFLPDCSAGTLPEGVVHEPGALTVAAEAQVDTPLHVVHLASGAGASTLATTRLTIDAGDHSAATIVETFHDLDGGTTTDATTVVRTGTAAQVRLVCVQDHALDAAHLGSTRVEPGRDATVELVSIMAGSDIARHEIEAGLTQPGAVIDLHGLYVPRGRQRHDTVVTVEHGASHCTSRQHFRGVIDDAARGSFSGHVIVREGTVGTDADQTNRNVVLTPTAEADTRPWLEILADDVRCSHGATVGRLDEDALFYLRSRGIPLPEARAVLVGGFTGVVLEAVPDGPLRTYVEDVLVRHGSRS